MTTQNSRQISISYCIKCDVRYESKSGRCPSCDGKGVKYEEQDKD